MSHESVSKVDGPSARKDTSIPWDQYRKGLGSYLARVVAFIALLSLVTAVVWIIAGNNQLFIYIDLGVSAILVCCLLFRRHITMPVMVAIISVLAFALAIPSFVRGGFVGTGVIVLACAQLIGIVFVKKSHAAIIGAAAVLLIVVLGTFVHLDWLTFGSELTTRMNSLEDWVTQAIAMTLFVALAVTAVDHLRARFLHKVAEVEELAYLDRLTGLPNRHRFRDHVERRIAAGVRSAFLVIVNMKQFRVINVLYGNRRGDELLKKIGDILSSFSGKTIVIARLSGDEFAGWVEGVSEENLRAKLERLWSDLKARLPEEQVGHRLEYYSAFARYPEDGSSYEDCLSRADIALRLAKEAASTTLTGFQADMMPTVTRELTMRRLLRHAIDTGEFDVHYQTKIRLEDRAVVGVEALARWDSTDLGPVSPAEFVPVINRAGIMIPFGKEIFERILRDVPDIHRVYGSDVSVSVNISPVFFLYPGFAEYVVATLHRYAVAPKDLTLEITEEVFVDDIRTIQSIVRTFREQEVRVALDDFGKGFSSLYYISHIHLDELKVDKSFIDRICEDPRSFRLFNSICDIADIYQYEIVAEGVEHQEQVDKLRETSCQIVQGYHFAQPEPLPGRHPPSNKTGPSIG